MKLIEVHIYRIKAKIRRELSNKTLWDWPRLIIKHELFNINAQGKIFSVLYKRLDFIPLDTQIVTASENSKLLYLNILAKYESRKSTGNTIQF